MDVLAPGAEISDPLVPYLEVDRSRPRHECWVVGHMVTGLDGTAAIDGRVGSLSTRPDRELFRRMREIADVVLVGAETVRREGYGPVRLTESARGRRRSLGQSSDPPIAIVSRTLDLDWAAGVFADTADSARTLVVTSGAADPRRRAAAERVATVIEAGEDRVDPAAALRALAELGHRVVLCEGGPTWLGEIVAADRLDELCLTVSPLMGGDALPVSVTPPGTGTWGFDLKWAMSEDHTLFLRYERADAERRTR